MASHLRLLPLLLLLLALSAISPSSADGLFIVRTCSQTASSVKCVALLQSDKRSYDATTVQPLAQIALNLTTIETSKVLSTLTTLRDQHSGEPIEEPLGQCAEMYSNAVDELQDAAESLASQSYEDATKSVDDAQSMPDSCEAAFEDGLKSPVTEEAQIVKDDLSVTYDLLDLLSG
ncbi:hypothetical protein QJS10_CPB18g00357 [Acorus calamus]|uniref:Pectinesterase inhibitor domain-containing protein n=1 Tax=Acorus calamus TaxID=4465 RepID=A0AAV9CQN8_ACOCL|nr:hypothetical protein QJS10_CPB18g00357 [Acorus calamus]